MRAKVLGEKNHIRTVHDFGIKDDKGRSVGCVIWQYEIEFVPACEGEFGGVRYNIEPGQYFAWSKHATRDGVEYGAFQYPRYCRSDEARVGEIKSYLRSTLDRAKKKWGTNATAKG